MKTITIQISDQEFLVFQKIADSPHEWTKNLVRNRIRKEVEKIVQRFVDRASRENVPIPNGQEAIVADAIRRGWV